MLANWAHFLPAVGAKSIGDSGCDFAALPTQQRLALETGYVVSPLLQLGCIAFSGEDTTAFLHAQLCSHVLHLEDRQAQYSGYLTPKGRVLAFFLLFRKQQDFYLQLSTALRESVQKRLALFILRRKTQVHDASQKWCGFGLAGPLAAQILQAVWPAKLPELFSVSQWGHRTLIALPGGRFQLWLAPEDAMTVWRCLTQAGFTPVGTAVWSLSEIREGIPWIGLATQEAFVPQMLNMELMGALHLKKGCYPGQEIVARTQYLGTLKQRMFRATAPCRDVKTGDKVYSPAAGSQACGTVVLAAPTSDRDSEMLVVVRTACLESGLFLGHSAGSPLTRLPLPYTVPLPFAP